MMLKKHVVHNNNLIKEKEAVTNRNAKVTVQYIQTPQLFQTSSNIKSDHHIMHSAQEDLEIENVEYLEENTNVDVYIEEPCSKDELEDIFYPNAIYCLLDLYKSKYESIIRKNASIKVAQLWGDIAKNMQESLFDFNERQIQHKYALLREQYFGVQTKEDIENFDYFEQLHDIYKDLSKENIAKGFNDDKVGTAYYKDEIFLQPEHLENDDRNVHGLKNDEIAHKEHEFVDMVEKELQAMEDGIETEDNREGEINGECIKKRIKMDNLKNIENSLQPPNSKRIRYDSDICEDHSQRTSKLDKNITPNELMQETCYFCNKSGDFSLHLYNQEQERRHREKMHLLEKSLQIQERALIQQQELLQELIKRLPS